MRSVPEARSLLLARDDLAARGWSSRRIRTAVESGELRRVHPGQYVDAEVWAEAYGEDKHLLRVVAAAAARSDADAVHSHAAAAVLHGLPLLGAPPERVDLSGPTLSGHVRRDPRIARHETAVPDGDVVEIGGIRCTSLARTVADLIRTSTPEGAVAVADAGFGRLAWDRWSRRYDSAAHDTFAEDVRERMERVRAARGVRQGREVLGIADGRAESPGESLNRLQLMRAGFREIRLQVGVPGPNGERYTVDVGLDEVPAWVEFDGAQKYTDPAMRGGRTIEDVILEEKRREDWIRASTDRRILRYGFSVVRSTRTLERHLASLRVFAPAPAHRTGILRATR